MFWEEDFWKLFFYSFLCKLLPLSCGLTLCFETSFNFSNQMLFLDKIFKDFSLFFLSKNLNHNRGPILPPEFMMCTYLKLMRFPQSFRLFWPNGLWEDFSIILNHLPLTESIALHEKKPKFPQPKDVLCQVKLKLAVFVKNKKKMWTFTDGRRSHDPFTVLGMIYTVDSKSATILLSSTGT